MCKHWMYKCKDKKKKKTDNTKTCKRTRTPYNKPKWEIIRTTNSKLICHRS